MNGDLKNYVPQTILDSIKKHLRKQGNAAHSGWLSNSADEDSCTGDLGRQLRTNGEVWHLKSDRWSWSIDSKKFGGKGPRAPESIIGADAIVEFTVTDSRTGESVTKGLLVQAKMDGSSANAESQVRKMEKTAKGCSALVDYSEDGYRAVDGREYLAGKSHAERLSQHSKSLGDYLADVFVECNVGVLGLRYDARQKQLEVPRDIQGSIRVPAKVQHRFRITTVGPVRLT